ncbi:putative periplasmic binding protein-like I [Helianthus annuus]|uniref:Periplasmic binding protein-like I n=1 Tax=Helianthus annuus TaxID=4232 RepID=A0A9K3HRY6_HELAN|nr:putative periplasmic binding protein-like I [Helianthus annuus]
MESRVVVVITYGKTGLLVFETAKRLSMMKKGYIWITTTWLSNVLDYTGISSKYAFFTRGSHTSAPHTRFG